MRRLSFLLLLAAGVQQPVPQLPVPPPVQRPLTAGQPPIVPVRAIEPPKTPLPAEADSATVTRFSFIAYGDTRGANDGVQLHREHQAVVEGMIARAKALASTPFPVKFVVQSGDAVLNGRDGNMWNISFVPVIEELTRTSDIPYFFSVGNHDVTTLPLGDPQRALGLKNSLDAMAKLIPAEGSPRRLNGYLTYAFGFGNTFFIVLDSNIASDQAQLAWVTKQLEGLDRGRYHHVFAVFHHPPFSSGPHGGDIIEPQTEAIRALYMPLFRKHHVRGTFTGHDHFLDHWVERYTDGGREYRMDDVLSGGGGAPTYTYKGEPNLKAYLENGAAQHVRVEHLIRPGATAAENPNHFIVIQVDGDKLSLEVIGIGAPSYRPYGKIRLDLNAPTS
jgi:calcineurin-like phosphoesterase family protein